MTTQPENCAGLFTFMQQHVENVLSRAIAKELSELFLVKGDLVSFDELYEMFGRIYRKRRLGKVRIARDKTRRVRVKVREIAATAARNKYLSTNPLAVIEKDCFAPP